MLTIRARAPLRLGLAGGGTDVVPYCDVFGGAILNSTIDRYAYAILKELDGRVVRFIAADLNVIETISFADLQTYNGPLKLHVATYSHLVRHFNSSKPIPLELTTYCDAPPGSGLGSSSTVVVAILRAFVDLLNIPLSDYDIAGLAYKIERLDCGLKGGKQDQYSATFGGFNFMEFFGDKNTIITPLRIKNWIICELEASLVLYFGGVSRDSSEIIEEQSKALNENSHEALEAMHALKKEAIIMKNCLIKGDFNAFVESIRRGWTSKKRTAKAVSNQSIEKTYSAALAAGALAGKVSGAGGGGFMWFIVPTENRMRLVRTLESMGGIVSNCHFTKYGCQAWRI